MLQNKARQQQNVNCRKPLIAIATDHRAQRFHGLSSATPYLYSMDEFYNYKLNLFSGQRYACHVIHFKSN